MTMPRRPVPPLDPDTELNSARFTSNVTDELLRYPLERLQIDSLVPADSPRLEGEDSTHIISLAEVGDQLPPIVVHTPSMRVIDGMHRVRAAATCGATEISARMVTGSLQDAFLLAVRLNVAHGLPLSRADRVAAVKRIGTSHPEWSDGLIANVVGLSIVTVGKIRRRFTEESDRVDARVGRDGRVRPINGAAGRALVSKLLTENRSASLREIAMQAGVSPTTVQDVRRRMDAGEDPLPARQRSAAVRAKATTSNNANESPTGGQSLGPSEAIANLVGLLRKDPSLRFNDSGRTLIRWLDSQLASVSDWRRMVRGIPAHCNGTVAELARAYAAAWGELAKQIESIDSSHHSRRI